MTKDELIKILEEIDSVNFIGSTVIGTKPTTSSDIDVVIMEEDLNELSFLKLTDYTKLIRSGLNYENDMDRHIYIDQYIYSIGSHFYKLDVMVFDDKLKLRASIEAANLMGTLFKSGYCPLYDNKYDRVTFYQKYYKLIYEDFAYHDKCKDKLLFL